MKPSIYMNGLMKQSCYHVYFEKSEAFEDYLFATGHQEREIKVKETRAERGKYGIALNNNIGKKEEPVKEIAKFNLSKVASWGTILALTGVLTAMGLNGDLDALGQGVKGLADNVMNRESNEPSLDNIIPINGSPSNTIDQDESASVNAEVTSSKEDNATEENETTTENENPETSESSTEDNTSTEKESDEEVAADNTSSTEENGNSGASEEETTEESEETNISGNKTTYKTYIVEKGDTLYSIAMELYKDADKVKEIVEINNLEDENYVMEGQKIFLP